MKIVAIGDLHGRSSWQLIVEKHKNADLYIFLGDYWDSHDITFIEQLNNFHRLCEFKKINKEKVILLLGNHDPGIGHYSKGSQDYSGFQEFKAIDIMDEFYISKHLFQAAFAYKRLLFTHAGVSDVFMDEVYGENSWKQDASEIAENINELAKYKPLAFQFDGNRTEWVDGYGNNAWQSPVWIRPPALMKYSPKIKKAGIIQIVGHTSQYKIDYKGKATGGKFFFIDTLGTSGEYLIIEESEGKYDFKTDKI